MGREDPGPRSLLWQGEDPGEGERSIQKQPSWSSSPLTPPPTHTQQFLTHFPGLSTQAPSSVSEGPGLWILVFRAWFLLPALGGCESPKEHPDLAPVAFPRGPGRGGALSLCVVLCGQDRD